MEGLPLTELAPGDAGSIVSPSPSRPVPLRMRELGFVPGTVVEVIRHGAFGDPVEVALRGYRICIRRSDLEGVRVQRCEPPS